MKWDRACSLKRPDSGDRLFPSVSSQTDWTEDKQHRQRAAVRVHLDDLQLHSLVRLRALEAVADGFHQAVDEPLAGGPAVGGISCDVAVRDEFLPGKKNQSAG